MSEDVADSSEHESHSTAPLRNVELPAYEPASELLRALSSPIRLAIIDLLADAPRCVHELVDAIGTAQPLISQHLKSLRGAGLVRSTRRGREVVYTLADEHVAHIARDTIAHARE